MKTKKVVFKIHLDRDFDEYQVQVWINGTLDKDKTYHASDREDAASTMEVMKNEFAEHPERYEAPVPATGPLPNLGITFDQWFEALKGFIDAGNCLIEDDYGVEKINRVSIADNSKGKATGIVFHADR